MLNRTSTLKPLQSSRVAAFISPCRLSGSRRLNVLDSQWTLSVHSLMMEKSAQYGVDGGCTPPPFTISTLMYKVEVTSLAERAYTLPLQYFYSTPLCTLCSGLHQHPHTLHSSRIEGKVILVNMAQPLTKHTDVKKHFPQWTKGMRLKTFACPASFKFKTKSFHNPG